MERADPTTASKRPVCSEVVSAQPNQPPYLPLLEGEILFQISLPIQLYRAEYKAKREYFLTMPRVVCPFGSRLFSGIAQTDLCSIHGNLMLTVAANARIFLYKDPVNMRRSFEGLGSISGKHKKLPS
ncbi:MAG: hypothetical protein KGJ02_06995 [Verrucomicrobiota bacterium]|nr:hypothetical protein [Verrucomicrobiota bacterium]